MDPIIALQGEALQRFLDLMEQVIWQNQTSAFPVHTLRIAIDGGGVKVKVNEFTWTRPMGVVQ